MVMRKWLNIGSKESDYSDDPADDNEDDTESDSDTEEWGRQSRFRDSRVDEAPNEESNGRRTSIACSKQLNNGSLHQQEEEEAAQTPTTKQAIKALTAQIKDMAGKASGAYKNCKPCLGSSNGNKNRKYADSDNGSDSAREIFFFSRFCITMEAALLFLQGIPGKVNNITVDNC